MVHRKRGLLLLAVLLQQVEHTGPASAVIFARDRLIAETAVRHFHVCATAGEPKLPADETAALRLVVPVSDPCISQNAWRIEFNDLSMSFEFAHAIDFELAGGIGGLEALLAADARVHFKNGNLADVVVPPLHLLDGVGQGAKHALGRGGDIDFTDDCVEIRSDDGSWHMCSSLLVLLAARRFFRVFGLHKSFQAGQIGAPKNAVLFQPGVNSFQRLWIQRVKAMAAFPSLLDQMRAPQQAEMLRDCRTGNRKCAGDLAGGLASAAQQVKDGTACGIGEGLRSEEHTSELQSH